MENYKLAIKTPQPYGGILFNQIHLIVCAYELFYVTLDKLINLVEHLPVCEEAMKSYDLCNTLYNIMEETLSMIDPQLGGKRHKQKR
jgi:hypothetical protein